MRLSQLLFENGNWKYSYENNGLIEPQLVMCFGDKAKLAEPTNIKHLRHLYPKAQLIACSTSGEIHNSSFTEDTLVATAIELEKAFIRTALLNICEVKDSNELGIKLAKCFDRQGLKFLFVVSDGQLVNGGDLVNGLNDTFENTIPISGGLAGDGANFKSTLVGLNETIGEGNVVGIGFYGDSLQVGCASRGGWGQFGPSRTITRSDKNVLYEIDGENALDLYKKYLAEYAEQLPSSALLFPLAIEEEGYEIVRTILSVDQQTKSMTFAGNMPEGAKVRLMKANLDSLVHAASDAAELSKIDPQSGNMKLSILISCVGRKLIFGNRIEEELEAAREILGENALIAGFYSYGEISPFSPLQKCRLHNQTMTITTISEN